ncbi:hypothetical protein AU509_09540 [Lonsdalea britannica]|nr:hypothetical protein AU509_09540 [Lonsdalea britannica]
MAQAYADDPAATTGGNAATVAYLLLVAGNIGGIALVVGGVDVMNVMVMNITERRHEISVRMTLGYGHRH